MSSNKSVRIINWWQKKYHQPNRTNYCTVHIPNAKCTFWIEFKCFAYNWHCDCVQFFNILWDYLLIMCIFSSLSSPCGMHACCETSRTSIELGDVTPHNIKQLKKLNTVVFPVSYNDKFYIDVLDAGELAKLAYYNDIVVGAVCCRIDMIENRRKLYIMTLGCLYPYRRLGIGSVMVNHILNYVKDDGNFDSIYLWVQISH